MGEMRITRLRNWNGLARMNPRCVSRWIRALGMALGLSALAAMGVAQPAQGRRPVQPPGQRHAFSGWPEWRGETIFTGEVIGARLGQPSGRMQGGPGGGPAGGFQPARELQAEVNVLRVLHGRGAQPGEVRQLRFPFPPGAQNPFESGNPGGNANVRLPGLFFLDRAGNLLPVRFAGAPSFLGGSHLPLPAETLSAPKNPTGQVHQAAGLVIAEVVAAMEFWASAYGPQLDAAGAQPARGFFPTLVAGHFQQLTSLLAEVEPEPFVEMLEQFTESPSAHIRLAGVYGLIRMRRLDALALLERDFGLFARAMQPLKLFQTLRTWDVAANPRSVDVVGRLALHENLPPLLESSFANGLSDARIPDAMPYLIALSGSPHADTRAAALRGICRQTHGGGIHGSGEFLPKPRPALFARYVPAEIDDYCPQDIPIRNRQREQRALQFWQAWWPGVQETIAADFRRTEHGTVLAFPEVQAPTRWLDTRQASVELAPTGPKVALRQLLYPFRPNSLRGTEPEAMLRRMLPANPTVPESDWTIAANVLHEHAVKLQALDESFQRATMARGGGAPDGSDGADGQAMRAAASEAASERMELVEQCWQQLERGLSAHGWKLFQATLKDRSDRQQEYRLTAPPGIR